jgi:N-lysine methyltransferase SETD6
MTLSNGGEDDFNAKSAAFLSWLQKPEIGASISPKIRLADLRDQDAGRGVVATTDIAEDEGLFKIPRSAVLTAENCTLANDIKKEVDDPWLSLIVAMIYEYGLGASSKWKPYFDILPRDEDFDTLMYWSEEELKELQGSAVRNKIGRASADERFNNQVIPVLRKHANAFNTATASDQELLALCHRMGSTIMAYAFDLEKPESDSAAKDGEDGWEEDEEDSEVLPKGMVPLADILNADADRNNAKLFYEEDAVIMKSIKPIAAGEEIFNDYGPLPSADVVRRYGYVTPNYAQYDVLEFSLDLIKKALSRKKNGLSAQDLEERLAYLDEQGVLDDSFDICWPGQEEGPYPDELIVLLNTLAIPRPDFEKLKRKEKLPKPTFENNLDSLTLFGVALEERFAKYGDTPPQFFGEEIEKLKQERTSSARRKAMAYQVVKGEKEILSALATEMTSVEITRKRMTEYTELDGDDMEYELAGSDVGQDEDDARAAKRQRTH